MRTALAGIFVILLGIATALAIPRNAGDEYRLEVMWTHSGEPGPALLLSGLQEPEIAPGPDSILIFDRVDWQNRFSIPRQAVSVESSGAYINQTTQDRWLVRLLENQRTVFVDASGFPRLYGTVLARFEAQRVDFRALQTGVDHTIFNDGTLTTVDAVPIDTDGVSGMVIISGDVFGVITGALRTSDGAGDADFVTVPTSQLFLEAVPTVYTIAILHADSRGIRFVTLRGHSPQQIEIMEWIFADQQSPQVVMSVSVPAEHQRMSPVPVGKIDRNRVLLGLSGAVLLVDPIAGSGDLIASARNPEWLGGFSQGITGQIMIVADDHGVTVQLDDFDRNSDRSRSATWSFPGTTPAYSGPQGWILERNGVFVAMDVVR